jgi:dienelactone hydrolase
MVRSALRIVVTSLAIFGMAGWFAPASAQGPREDIAVPREYRGKPIQVPAKLLLPPGAGKVPAMVIHHGSGGISEGREFRYARELVAMGVAAVVIDSFAPRGIASTVQDQSQVSAAEMADDALAMLKFLSAHARIDPARVGLMGFSKGGTVALETYLERRAARILPAGPRFALHIALYPSCANQAYRPKLTGGRVLMLLGGADTYVGVAPCTEWADKLRSAGADVEVKVYPNAKHGFDGDQAYSVAKGENWSNCIFDEQPDGSWKERKSGQVTFANGRRVDAGMAAALAACRTQGVSGGPNPAAKAAAMNDVKAAVKRHLLPGT